MLASVVNRFVIYDVNCDKLTLKYIKTIHAPLAHQEWIEAAMKEA